MNIRNLLFILFTCNTASAHDIKLSECSHEQLIQQDRVYWCLMDKYQQSLLALKKEEASAEKRLKKYDKESARGHDEDGSIDYEPYIHIARITFPELHRSFIFYREQQCKYASQRDRALPGYRSSISALYCKTNINMSQTQWIKDTI